MPSTPSTMLTTDCKREEAITKLLEWERIYVRTFESFSRRLETWQKGSSLSLHQVNTMTVNARRLLDYHLFFLSTLEQLEMDGHLFVDRIGPVLIKHAENLVSYVSSCTYIPTAEEIVAWYKSDLTSIEVTRSDFKWRLRPMGLIKLYIPFFKDIANFTPPGQDLTEINVAIEIVRDTVRKIEKDMRLATDRHRLAKVAANLPNDERFINLMQPTEYLGERKLIRSDLVFHVHEFPYQLQRITMVVFNDFILLLKGWDRNAWEYHYVPIPLYNLVINRIGPATGGFMMTLSSPALGYEEVRIKVELPETLDSFPPKLYKHIKKAAEAHRAALHNT